MQPMLASKGDQVPSGAEWVHEIKWDGIRALADTRSGELKLWSRNDNNVAAAYPELAGLTTALAGRPAVLDGEIVCFADGRPSFGALAHRMHVRDARRAAALAETNPVTYLSFDILALDGHDLTKLPLAERREILTSLDLMDDHWQTPTTYPDGQMLYAATREQGLEGIVSKRLASTYHQGARTRHWLKFPHRHRNSYVIGGWRFETDSTTRLGAILVGEPTPGGVLYRGRVGSGIAGKTPALLKELLGQYARQSCPFADEVPKADALGTQWVEPVLVADIEALGLSSAQRLRQPAFVGVRTDLSAADLIGGPDE